VNTGHAPFAPMLYECNEITRTRSNRRDRLAHCRPGNRTRTLLHGVCSAFLFKDAIFPPANLVGRLFFPAVVRDATEMETIVQRSGLDWTIVRPPRLTDKPPTGKYRVSEGHLPRFGLSISRADVADFMLRTAQNPTSNKKIVGVSN
jgi:putative NADH-flavin reductase